MKPGSRDRKVKIKIDGEELAELKRLTWMMAEAFGLDRRIEKYEGKKHIGLYRWDMECLMDVVEASRANGRRGQAKATTGLIALKNLHTRLKAAYQEHFSER